MWYSGWSRTFQNLIYAVNKSAVNSTNETRKDSKKSFSDLTIVVSVLPFVIKLLINRNSFAAKSQDSKAR
jgi:hypothetical protein